MPKVCFVTNEIAPITSGGAGTLIHKLIQSLLLNDFDVVLILDVSAEVYSEFNKTVEKFYRPDKRLKHYKLSNFCSDIEITSNNFDSRYFWESYKYYWGCKKICEIEKPDIIEFVDYCGPAYFSLCAKKFGIAFSESLISVRIHGPIQTIDRYTGKIPLDFDRYAIYALEQKSFELADVVLFPSSGIYNEFSSDRKLWNGKQLISTPPEINNIPPVIKSKEDNVVLFYGRLFPEKGAEIFLRSALQLLKKSETKLNFVLVGSDSFGPQGTGFKSYQGYLTSLIPVEYKNRFTFTGHLPSDQLIKILPFVKFAVFPSTFETFGYAAHEIRQAHIPIIVSQITAFKDSFIPDKDAIFFDGTINDLSLKMKTLENDEALLRTLSLPTRIDITDSISFYRNNFRTQNFVFNPTPNIKMVLLIIDDNGDDTDYQKTVRELRMSTRHMMKLYRLRKVAQGLDKTFSLPLLGDYYALSDDAIPDNSQSIPTTEGAMVILRSGDVIEADFLSRCVQSFENFPKLAFINCWRMITHNNRKWAFTTPFAAMPELIPVESISNITRMVFRTEPGIPIDQFFDKQTGLFAECNFLWEQVIVGLYGIDIPGLCVTQKFERISSLDHVSLTNLVNKFLKTTISTSLMRYLLLILNGSPRRMLPLQNLWTKEYHYPSKVGKPINLFPEKTIKQKIYVKFKKLIAKLISPNPI